MKDGSLKLATSRSIVLLVVVEMNDHSLVTVYPHNLLLSHFTIFIVENGIFGGSCRPEREGRRNQMTDLPAVRLYFGY